MFITATISPGTYYYSTVSTDLNQTLTMLDSANINYRKWSIKERLHGEPFEGTCVVIGCLGGGPYVEMMFKADGSLDRVEPAYDRDPEIIVAHTHDHKVWVERVE